jgi:uncharacterized protein (TIGR02271 family)
VTAERSMNQGSSTGGAGRSTVVGVFDDREHAEMAVRDLQAAGFNENQIGFAMRDSGGSGSGSHGGGGEVTTDTGPGSGALTGLTTGGLIGGVLGALASLAIPGVGPVVAAGILGPILGGAAAGAGIGAVGGGLVGGLVTTGVPEDEARIYDEEFRSGSAIVTVRADNRYGEAEAILRRHGGKFAQGSSGGAARASTQSAGFANTQTNRGATRTETQANQGEMRVPEVEERLNVQKRQTEMGEVRVHKEVEVEQQTIPVELEREEVHVERREVAARPLQAGEDAFQEGTIRVPVRGEEAVVSKEAVVTGEVVVNKDRHVEREQVTDTVRRTEVHVDDDDATRSAHTDTTRRDRNR